LFLQRLLSYTKLTTEIVGVKSRAFVRESDNQFVEATLKTNVKSTEIPTYVVQLTSFKETFSLSNRSVLTHIDESRVGLRYTLPSSSQLKSYFLSEKTTWNNANHSKGFMIRDAILMKYCLQLLYRLNFR